MGFDRKRLSPPRQSLQIFRVHYKIVSVCCVCVCVYVCVSRYLLPTESRMNRHCAKAVTARSICKKQIVDEETKAFCFVLILKKGG